MVTPKKALEYINETNAPVWDLMIRFATQEADYLCAFGRSLCKFRGKVIYNLLFSKHISHQNLYARMAQNWAEYGSKMADLGRFALFSQDLLCHTI